MSDTASAQADGNPQPDGGVAGGSPSADRWAASRERLRAYDRIRTLRRWAASPVESARRAANGVSPVRSARGRRPARDRLPDHPRTADRDGRTGRDPDRRRDRGRARELRRRLRGPQAPSPPDRVGGSRLSRPRLASVNGAGTSVVGSVRRVADSNLEALTDDLQRTRRDIDWGADVGTALRRLERRVRSPMTSRAVALITNAMRASGDVGPVLRIAADESRATWSLRRERRQVMLTYLIVIYISFLVFLGIRLAAVGVVHPRDRGGRRSPVPAPALVRATFRARRAVPEGSRTGLGTSTRPPTSSCSSTPPRYRRSVPDSSPDSSARARSETA